MQRVKRSDVVIMPFASSDGTCDFWREHLAKKLGDLRRANALDRVRPRDRRELY